MERRRQDRVFPSAPSPREIVAPHHQNRRALPSAPSPREIAVPNRQNRQFSSISCDCPSCSLHLILAPDSRQIVVWYMPHTNVSEAEHTKAGNVIRRTESQKLEEILLRKSTARISACLTGNSAAEIHSENLPSLKLSCSRISQTQSTRNSSKQIIWRKFCGGNPQRESP